MKELLLRLSPEKLGAEAVNFVAEVTDNITKVEETAAVESVAAVSDALFTANNVWMMLATALVFIMHLGFAGVEAGFGQAKNTVNILFKNTLTPIIGIVTYFILGFNLMYPGFDIPGWFGFSGWFISLPEGGGTASYASGGYTYWTDFLFQAMFAALSLIHI